MNKGAEFWLRISIVCLICIIIFLDPAILFPFILSLIIAVLLNPVALWIHGQANRLCHGRFPYDVAIILSFLVFLTVIYMIIIHILVPFVSEFREFMKSFPSTLAALQQAIPAAEAEYQFNLLPPEARNVISKILSDVGEYTLKIAQFSLSAIFSFASTVVELIVVPFITFYMMKKGGYVVESFIKLFPDRFRTHLRELFKETHSVLNAYIRGQLILSALMAFLVFLGMFLLDIPYPLVIGLVAGLVEMVPIIGPVIGAIPPVLLGLLKGTGVMVQVIIFYVVVQQLDSHFIMPKLMGHVIDVHPVAIIAGVLVGGHLFGVLGMMISVPTVAILQIILRHMWFYDRYKSLR